jgi:uncharacterized protein (TIGR03792 family)
VTTVIIEQLTFSVLREHLDDWLLTDAATWDAILAAQPGYLGKEVWITDADPAATSLPSTVEVQVIVRWSDRALWKSIDSELLAATHDGMGAHALSYRETVHITPDDPERDRRGTDGASA